MTDDINFFSIPLSALSSSSRTVLQVLDRRMVLTTRSGDFRDHRGLLKHADIPRELKEPLKTGSDFTNRILSFWIAETSSTNNNFGALLEILGKIDRADVRDDCHSYLLRDAEQYVSNGRKIGLQGVEGLSIITREDVINSQNGLRPQMYDTFLLYTEEDWEMGLQIEAFFKANGVSYCTQNSLIAGISFEHHAAMELIEDRCRRVTIVISRSFLDSEAHTFISKFAQHISIQRKTRKIVPILQERCETQLPVHLKFLFLLKYFNRGPLFNFWEKLFESLLWDPSIDALTDKFEYHGMKVDHKVICPAEKDIPEEPRARKEVPTFDPEKKQLSQSLERAQLEAIQALPSPPSSELATVEIKKKKKKRYSRIKSWLEKRLVKQSSDC